MRLDLKRGKRATWKSGLPDSDFPLRLISDSYFLFRRPSSIPQVIAAIGSAELPTGQWSELIQALVQNVNNVSVETLTS